MPKTKNLRQTYRAFSADKVDLSILEGQERKTDMYRNITDKVSDTNSSKQQSNYLV